MRDRDAHDSVLKADASLDDRQRREWIKYQLRLKDSSMAKIARRLGVSRQAVTNALVSPYPRMERAIAYELGTTPDQLWPERYVPRKH